MASLFVILVLAGPQVSYRPAPHAPGSQGPFLSYSCPRPQAESSQVRFAGDYDKAFEEASLRGVALLFLSFDSWGSDPWQEWFTDPRLIKSMSRVVVLIASQEDHGDKVEEIHGSPQKVCAEFGQITCHQHQRILDRCFQEFVDEESALITPHFILVSPKHAVLESREQEFELEELIAGIEQVIKGFPDGLEKSAFDRAMKLLSQAEIDIGAHLLEDGVPLLREAIDLAGRSPLAKRARALRRKVEDVAEKTIEQATHDAEHGKMFEALAALDDLAADLEGLGIDKEARRLQRELLKRPEARSFRKALKDHGRARTLFRRALALEKDGRTAMALKSYRKIVVRYRNSPFAERARLRVGAIEKESRREKHERRGTDRIQTPWKRNRYISGLVHANLRVNDRSHL